VSFPLKIAHSPVVIVGSVNVSPHALDVGKPRQTPLHRISPVWKSTGEIFFLLEKYQVIGHRRD
jgi:exonuclease III